MKLIETLSEKTIDELLGKIKTKLDEVYDSYQWQKLFINTGKTLFDDENSNSLGDFQEEMYSIFSYESLKEIANNMKNVNGYDFIRTLHNQLYDLMIRFDIPHDIAENYIHNFNSNIIDYLKENDHQKMLEAFLDKWKKEDDDKYQILIDKLVEISGQINQLENKKIHLLTIKDIDTQIRRRANYKGIGLDFFEIDDEEFEIELKNRLENGKIGKISIVGNSREETLYRLLHELEVLELDYKTYIVKSEEEWNFLENENISNKILIPYFFTNSIPVIRNNVNIFIYNSLEPCHDKNKIQLRKRTRKNIINSLERYMCHHEAYMIVENTHGLYSPMKKVLFNEATFNKLEWVQQHSDTVMAALLCGQWQESTDDEKIFEKLSNENYEKSKKELMGYMYGENPFIIEIKDYSNKTLHLVSIEDAWQELDLYITDEMWDRFINLFYEIMIVSDYENPKNKLRASKVMKTSMIRSLIMRIYCCGHDENQRQVDQVIKKIFNKILTSRDWTYISNYIPDLCEASPKMILEALESELDKPTGMIEIFGDNDKYEFGFPNYTHILWAVEHLLQQKKYIKRTIDWLWRVNSYDIKYKLGNTPESILDTVFCAWVNTVPLTVEEKINYAKEAIKIKNAWKVIFSKLPNGGGETCTSLSTPKYREIDEPIEFSNEDVVIIYTEYLNICVSVAKENTDRWLEIINCLYRYDIETQKDVINKLVNSANKMNDHDKTIIKSKIRELIYQHRFYVNAHWRMATDNIPLYEKLLDEIVVQNPLYDYLYLFSHSYDFKLLNPVPYEKEEDFTKQKNTNNSLRKEEICTKFENFKQKGYSLNELIKLALSNNKHCVGEILAEFYCCKEYDENIYNILVEVDKEQKEVYGYLECLIYNNEMDISRAIEIAKKSKMNDEMISNLLKVERLDKKIKNLLDGESREVKEKYWGRNVYSSNQENYDMYIWSLKECKKYGTFESYINLLYDLREQLDVKDLYQGLVGINQIKKIDTISSYELCEILKILQNQFIDDFEKCKEISKIEWQFKQIIKWENMQCTQRFMKSDPSMYAELIKIMYKTENDEEVNDEKQKLATELFSTFYNIHFCPCEYNGKVKYEDLESWIEMFKELLSHNKQEKLFGSMLGKLLPYSPVGEDGIMPCEAVRKIIEKYHSKELSTSYCITEENKRGVYTVTAGKAENEMAQNYRNIAETLQKSYPYTAEIYFNISDSYKAQSMYERRRAEDEY